MRIPKESWIVKTSRFIVTISLNVRDVVTYLDIQTLEFNSLILVGGHILKIEAYIFCSDEDWLALVFAK